MVQELSVNQPLVKHLPIADVPEWHQWGNGCSSSHEQQILTKPTSQSRKEHCHIANLKSEGTTAALMVTVNLATYTHTSKNVRFVASMATLGTGALINRKPRELIELACGNSKTINMTKQLLSWFQCHTYYTHTCTYTHTHTLTLTQSYIMQSHTCLHCKVMQQLLEMDRSRPEKATAGMLPGSLRHSESPVNQRVWRQSLSTHPDQQFAQYILKGLEEGFRIRFQHQKAQLRQCKSNMANKNKSIASEYLDTELHCNWLVTLSKSEAEAKGIHCSLIGVIPKNS